MLHKIILFTILISNLTHANNVNTSYGIVTNIFDGDTIEISHNNKKRIIRLAYIDAPEINQVYGDRAKRNLDKNILNKRVNYKIIDQDIYNRYISLVYLDNININKKQIHDGYAWATHRTSSNSYLSLELQSKYYKKGLWQSKSILSPWIFRKQHFNDTIK